MSVEKYSLIFDKDDDDYNNHSKEAKWGGGWGGEEGGALKPVYSATTGIVSLLSYLITRNLNLYIPDG